jgi:glycerol-3-phosphate dehydrogenase (NAD(P)+)
MPNILIIGAGVMGSALAIPALDNGHSVILAGTPLDAKVISLLKEGSVHPKLHTSFDRNIVALEDQEVTPEHAASADLLIVGVSSDGIPWVVKRLNELLREPKPVAFVTKGLDRAGDRIVTYAESLPALVPYIGSFIGIGGPCIARELSNRTPTLSIYASGDRIAAEAATVLMRTSYYRLATTNDAVGVEACAALKNFFAIGVSAMQTRYPDQSRADGQSKNPAAGAFNQAVQEMADLCEYIGGMRGSAFDLAGLGDLHVTVGGGRNSRLGHGLGADRTIPEVLRTDLAGETVEGVQTAWIVDDLLHRFGDYATRFPLATAISRAVTSGGMLDFDFSQL